MQLFLLLLYVFLSVEPYNVTKLQNLIDRKESFVQDICKSLVAYYSSPTTNCTRIESCDSQFGEKIISIGGTVQCLDHFGFDDVCYCNQSEISVTHSSLKYAPTLSYDERYEDPEIDKFVCSMFYLGNQHHQIFQKDPLVKWQYLSSPTGLITIYPGTIHSFYNETQNCKRKTDCSEFDPRERPWYISAVSGPKDIILVLDRSASMVTGPTNRLELLKQASLTVLGGLGPQDRLSIVHFADTTQTCSSDLLFMNSTNREIFEDCIDNMASQSGTNFYKAFDEAFNILDRRSILPFTCHTSILFLTDGFVTAGIKDEELLTYISSRNNHDISAQIFSFSIGNEADVVFCQKLACETKGVWAPIEDDATDFRKKMSGYYNYFIFSNNTRGTVWTNSYVDILGLGNMTTATMGCFLDSSRILGVVGIDILIKEFEDEGFDFAKIVYPELYKRSSACYDLKMSDEQLENLRVYHKCYSSTQKEGEKKSEPVAWVVVLVSIFGSIVFVLFFVFTCCLIAMFCLCCLFLCCGCFILTCQLLLLIRQRLNLNRYKDLDSDALKVFLVEQKINKETDRTSTPSLRINKDLFEVDFSTMQIHRRIGGGGSTAVGIYEATWEGRKVAFKCFRISDLCSQSDFEEFEREVEILASIHHPNITTFYGATLKNPRVGIVMEFCENGDLKSFLMKYRKKRKVSFPLRTKLEMLTGIASAMRYLHGTNIIHRDLKCENCLVTRHYETKVVDFGLSKVMDKILETQTKRIGTTLYMAPEVVRGESYSNRVDVFPFGIMMFEVITDVWNPYGNVPLINLEFKVACNPNFRPVVEKYISKFTDCKWTIELMKKCWDADPLKRPTYETIFKLFMRNVHGGEVWTVGDETPGRDVIGEDDKKRNDDDWGDIFRKKKKKEDGINEEEGTYKKGEMFFLDKI